jgi:hypothetical protein
MSAGEQGSGFGTVFHPEPDLAANGGAGQVTAGQLRSLPRRRRPGMIALAIVLVGVGILASAALYKRENHQVSVIMVTAPVAAGAPISAADLGTTSVTAGPGIKVIPAGQLGQVSGLVAATSLRPGTLLAPSELTSALPPAPGEVLVPVPVKPAMLPASGLAEGDHVTVIPTHGTVPNVLIKPVSGVVEAVRATPDQNGFDVVDLLVRTASGIGLAQQAASGQITLIITKRGG